MRWGKKNLIRELSYKGEEKHRERERETKVSDSEGVRKEKAKRERVRERTMRERLFSKKKNLENNL